MSTSHDSPALSHVLNSALPPAVFNSAYPIDNTKTGSNARSNLNDLSDLVPSIMSQGIVQPPGLMEDGTIIYGHRRIAAGKLAGLVTIPALIYPMLSLAQIKIIQLTENLLRKDMPEQDTYCACVELEALGTQRKDIAIALGVSAGSVTKYFSPDACLGKVPEAKEHFLTGRLTLNQLYLISTSERAQVMMDAFLGGATREQAIRKAAAKPPVEDQSSQDDGSDSDKLAAVRIDLANAKVIVKGGVKGSPMTLAQVVEILSAAKKAAECGRDEGLSIRSFSGMMADRAKKPAVEKKKRGKRNGVTG